MRYRDSDHYAPPDEPEPGAAELYERDCREWERGKEQAKAERDVLANPANRSLITSLTSQYVIDMERLLRSGTLPTGKAAIVRSEVARAQEIIQALRP